MFYAVWCEHGFVTWLRDEMVCQNKGGWGEKKRSRGRWDQFLLALLIESIERE